MTQPVFQDVTRRIAEFCVALKYEDLPSAAVEDAKKAVLDWLGVALVGSREESTRIVSGACVDLGEPTGTATLLGTGAQTSPAVATLVNGLAGHALDYDDVQHRCGVHMSAPVLPVALMLAETRQRSGKDLLTAYVAGFEVGCRLGRAARFGNYLHMHGIHPTGFLGHFGAAAAAGKLLRLNTLQMQRNLGIVAGKAAAMMRSFGTMCKPLNAGNAAQDGLFTAMLAQAGLTGPEDIFEGEHNIFSITGGHTDAHELVRALGEEYEITHNTFKAYACTGWRNPIAEAAILLATTHALQPGDVKKMHVLVYSDMMRLPDKPEPRTGLEGKFSVAHVCAVALTDRAAGIAQFTDQRVADSRLAALRRRVTFEASAEMDRYQARMLIETTDGRQFNHFVPVPKGDHLRPMSRDELVAKFRANALVVLPPEQVERLTAVLWDLEAVGDVAELMRLCRPGT